MKKLALLSLSAACSVYAGGYKIPETSVNSMALGAANIAHTKSADASYYNPANMVFMKDENALEANLLVIGLQKTNYQGTAGGIHDGVNIDAESETFFIPSMHYVSPEVGMFRFGMSVVVPGGLTKRWTDSPAVDVAEEFTLQVVEVNPTVAIKLGDQVGLAIGARVLHSSGVIKSSSVITRNMEGDSYDYGYNLALSYRPIENLSLALTYRSQVDLTEEGTAQLYTGSTLTYDGGATVTVPLPALANIAVAYTLPTKTTIELVYERALWSAYETLDFNYAGNIGALGGKFDDPIAKDWIDTNAYRLGLTQEYKTITAMFGLVYDENPVPDDKVSFELPDSNSITVSGGARYTINESWNVGAAAMYSVKEARTVSNEDVEGEFSNSNIFLMSAGVEYKF